MSGPQAAQRVPAGHAGIPPAAATIDLRLDGNQGRAPTPAFFDRLGRDGELLRRYPLDRSLEVALAARHGVTADRVFVGAGADDVLQRLCLAVLEPGRAAIVPVPTFEMLPRYVALAGANAITPRWDRGPWPRQQVLAAIGPDTAMVALVSPNNPTGLCATADDLRAVLAAEPHALVLVDAAYAEFGGEDLSSIALSHPHAVVVRTFSKAFGLAGLRIGYAIASPTVVTWLRGVGSPFTAGTFARAAAWLRLQDEGTEVADYVTAVAAERDALAAQLQQLGLEPLPSAGNFVYVRGGDPLWVRDALAGLGIAVRAFADGLRITVPGDVTAFARLQHALAAALAPQALVLDLDGVLADIERRTALASVDELAALAAKWPLAVVTSCPRRLAESVLTRHGFAPHIAVLVGSEDGPGKPDPFPVRLALQRLGAQRAWMLGDNPSDVQAARGANVVPLAIEPRGIGAETHAARLRAAGAARLVAGPAALLALR
ncbi:MAG: aminotransferase class I/II-fold pyridoxal phosphate-dependent enzyme [Planctomycetes bacterium]|jgi:histidinol-phosphate aminotransferase|nr:aminotransferase class I/II-fold pyridoxal phosphate-dependent enzyme [Planctomycetota bacterium]